MYQPLLVNYTNYVTISKGRLFNIENRNIYLRAQPKDQETEKSDGEREARKLIPRSPQFKSDFKP